MSTPSSSCLAVPLALAVALVAAAVPPAGAETVTVVTFESGAEGWSGPTGGGGATTVEASGGNPAHNMHTVFNDFGITFANATHPGFVFDYTSLPRATIAVDLVVHQIDFFGSPVSRPWLVELRDLDAPPPGYPWVSVWYKWTDVAAATHGTWSTFAVTIADTAAAALPPGWGGYGAEGPLGEPMLPPDRTFASVLAGVDEIVFTTFEPGWLFGFTDYDVRIDNPAVVAPEPVFAGDFESGDFTGWVASP